MQYICIIDLGKYGKRIHKVMKAGKQRMKIVCKRENDAGRMLAHVKHLLETRCGDATILKEDLVLEFSLKDKDGKSYPDNGEIICLEEKDLQNIESNESDLEYYNCDALTKLYNRSKYEQDIVKLQTDKVEGFTCIYIDTVGLHEINNHLGHAAGDQMLCSVADGIRQNFVNSRAYRIGGDEFVVFCFEQKEADIKQAIANLKEFLKQKDYEISVGMEMNSNDLPIMEIINRAEYTMRYDKEQFYKQNGEERQMRSLNYKLEKILLEKQDASHFLNAIAAEYKGVYMVNPDKDTCRSIYIPEYFSKILKKNNGIFSKAIRMYCSVLVSEKDQEKFQRFFDYDYIFRQIKQGNQITFTYEKKDGSHIQLQISIYESNSSDTTEILWIFMDGDLNK